MAWWYDYGMHSKYYFSINIAGTTGRGVLSVHGTSPPPLYVSNLGTLLTARQVRLFIVASYQGWTQSSGQGR